MCNMLHVTFFFGGGAKLWSLLVEGLVSMGPTPSIFFFCYIYHWFIFNIAELYLTKHLAIITAGKQLLLQIRKELCFKLSMSNFESELRLLHVYLILHHDRWINLWLLLVECLH